MSKNEREERVVIAHPFIKISIQWNVKFGEGLRTFWGDFYSIPSSYPFSRGKVSRVSLVSCPLICQVRCRVWSWDCKADTHTGSPTRKAPLRCAVRELWDHSGLVVSWACSLAQAVLVLRVLSFSIDYPTGHSYNPSTWRIATHSACDSRFLLAASFVFCLVPIAWCLES